MVHRVLTVSPWKGQVVLCESGTSLIYVVRCCLKTTATTKQTYNAEWELVCETKRKIWGDFQFGT